MACGLLALAGSSVGIAIAYLGLRADLETRIASPGGIAPVVAGLGLALGATLSGLAASIPGRSALQLAFLGAALAGAVLLLLSLLLGTELSASWRGANFWLPLRSCAWRVGLAGVVPVLAAAGFGTRAYPSNLWLAFGMGAFGMASSVSFVAHLSCPGVDAAHIALGHGLLPSLGLAAMACLLPFRALSRR